MQKIDLLIPSLLATILIIYHIIDFGLPILWHDEATWMVLTSLLLKSPDSELYQFSIRLMELLHGVVIEPYPLSWRPYIGTLSTYLMIPWVYVLDLNFNTLRIYQTFIASLIVFLTYFTGKELFNRQVGLVSSLLLLFLPFFIFFSRQNILYEWVLICFALIIIISAIRFLKTFKNRYLFLSCFLIVFSIWGYLWFAWFVLALVVTFPLYYTSLMKILKKYSENPKELSLERTKISVIASCYIFLGFIPLIIQFFFRESRSLFFSIPTYMGIAGHPKYQGKNWPFLENLSMRFEHFYEILARPGEAFVFATVEHPYLQPQLLDITNLVFPVLFLISLLFITIHVIKLQKFRKKLLGLSLLIFSILIFSSFTVSKFLPLQLGIILPFTMIFIAVGLILGIKFISKRIPKRIFFSPKLLLTFSLTIIFILQIPVIAQGYDFLESLDSRFSPLIYDKLENHIITNNLTPVTLYNNIDKELLTNFNGKIIPYFLKFQCYDWVPKNDQCKINFAHKFNNVYDKLFVVYTFYEEIDCSKVNRHTPTTARVCASIASIKNTADKLNKEVIETDFSLPNGDPFIKTYQIIN